MFDAVASLNVAFGNEAGDPKNPNWEKLESQSKNILDEYNELMTDGIAAKNMTEVRDAICDILVFTLGLAHMAGVPVVEDMAMVDASNRSKFCANPDQLAATVDKYNRLEVETYTEGLYPLMRVKSAKDQKDINGNNYPKGKMLKSVSFIEPVLRTL